GLGYLSPVLVGLLLCVPGISLVTWSAVLQRRRGGTVNGEHRVEPVALAAE
ncbi:MAG: transporter, family, inner rane transport protein, partial [Microbacteriaceae bacterium]|nr:transporter, family, inner rane transport protein [Microbacteriaceae bacterium]